MDSWIQERLSLARVDGWIQEMHLGDREDVRDRRGYWELGRMVGYKKDFWEQEIMVRYRKGC